MAGWTKDVYSTRALSVSYDPESKEMAVTWRNGKRTTYFGVPEDVALQLANAPSVGGMINSEITPFYRHRNA